MSNLELWDSVEKTDPTFTKAANVKGNKITAICPQYQLKKATERFGSYGTAWGFKEIEINFSLVSVNGLALFKALFYYPGGEFPIYNSISIWRDGQCTKPDDQFAKKAETDMLTKALSKLGFNADVFLGKFDDVRYVNDLKEELKKPTFTAPTLAVEKLEKSQWSEVWQGEIIATKTLKELQELWGKIPADMRKELEAVKDEQKGKLS